MGHPPLYVTLLVCPSVGLSVGPSVCLSVVHHFSGTVHHIIIILVQTCKMMISPGVFFIIFFEIFISWAVRGVKQQKIAQNEK